MGDANLGAACIQWEELNAAIALHQHLFAGRMDEFRRIARWQAETVVFAVRGHISIQTGYKVKMLPTSGILPANPPSSDPIYLCVFD